MTIERFSKDHELVRIDGDVATIGITAHAAKALGDVVYVELPDLGRKVEAGEATAVVESVKAASDIYAPLAGEVIAVNSALPKQPGLVNEDTEGAAWFFKLKLAGKPQLDGLMDRAAYDTFAATES